MPDVRTEISFLDNLGFKDYTWKKGNDGVIFSQKSAYAFFANEDGGEWGDNGDDSSF